MTCRRGSALLACVGLALLAAPPSAGGRDGLRAVEVGDPTACVPTIEAGAQTDQGLVEGLVINGGAETTGARRLLLHLSARHRCGIAEYRLVPLLSTRFGRRQCADLPEGDDWLVADDPPFLTGSADYVLPFEQIYDGNVVTVCLMMRDEADNVRVAGDDIVYSAAQAVAPTGIGPGVWAIGGTDAELGAATGRLEIRASSGGRLEATRVVTLEDVVAEDGRAVDLVWRGLVERQGRHRATLDISLRRADFISQVGDLVRTEADARPLRVVGELTLDDDGAITITYRTNAEGSFSVVDTGALMGPPADEPIFRAERFVRRTHPAPGPLTKASLFALFAGYHALPEVRPYTDDPEFERAVHLQVVERTDFDFYRANPDRLRVIDKVVDAISLAETKVRANAFRARLGEKAAFYQAGLSDEFLAPYGMVLGSIDGAGRAEPDFSSALWTGIYAYTQALRHVATGDTGALDDLREALRGLLALMDITGDPRTFARTLRPAGPPLTGSWRRGTGRFAGLDWLEGGNNDMAKGLMLGMIAGWSVLPEGSGLRRQVQRHARDLLELCVFMTEPAAECEAEPSTFAIPGLGLDLPSPDPDLPSINPGAARLLAGITNGDDGLIADGLDWLRQPALMASAANGGGPFFTYGISDWSGNHLTLTSTLILQWLLARTEATDLAQLWIGASAEAFGILRKLEHPLHAALAVASSALDDDPSGRRVATRKAKWGLRSFPMPKHPHPVDHRIRDGFVMSPFPALPWKLDWATNPDRQQSIEAPSMLEQGIDRYRWNAGHFAITAPGLGGRRVPGVDYLFLYWLARSGGIIGPRA